MTVNPVTNGTYAKDGHDYCRKLTLVSIIANGVPCYRFVNCLYVDGKAHVPLEVYDEMIRELRCETRETITIG